MKVRRKFKSLKEVYGTPVEKHWEEIHKTS